MEQLKRLRAEKGWSQAKLAVAAGLDPATVNQIETGARKPRAASLERLAEALEVSMADLFEGYELPPKAQAPLPLEGSQQRGAPSGEHLLEEAGSETQWLVMPRNDWLAAFRGQDWEEASRKLVEIATQMEDEYEKLMSVIFVGAPDPLGNRTLPQEYRGIWRQAVHRRLHVLSALEDLEGDQEAPDSVRDWARMLVQSMRKTEDSEFQRLRSQSEEQVYGRSYV